MATRATEQPSHPPARLEDDDVLATALRALVGDDAVLTGEEDRAFYAQDVYAQGTPPALVIRPATREQVSQAVAAATERGYAVFPRGGGMSYTSGFLPDTPRSVLLDTTRLTRVIEINARDLYAIVEAGCTWAALDAALAPHGVRATFWGPMSGGTATVGGAMSQGAATFGSGRTGASGATALGFEVVLADGRVLRTGADSQPGHQPFFRNYGPDLTGLFAHDAGALGIKTAVTLALEPRPAHVGALAFGFSDFDRTLAVVEQVAALRLASEIVVMDRALMRMNMDATSASSGLRALAHVVRSAPDVRSGLRRAVAITLAGKDFARDALFSAHIVTDSPDRRQLAAALAQIRRIGARGGRALPSSIGTVLRAMPFPELPVTAADGRRLLALHGIVPFSRGADLHRAIEGRLAQHRPALAQARVQAMLVCSTLGRNALLYEPFLYWKDSLELFHERRTPAAMAQKLRRYPPNPAARLAVERLRCELTDVFYEHGAVHLQIGRAYPYARSREPAFLDLLRAVKREVDPNGRINPGALGLR